MIARTGRANAFAWLSCTIAALAAGCAAVDSESDAEAAEIHMISPVISEVVGDTRTERVSTIEEIMWEVEHEHRKRAWSSVTKADLVMSADGQCNGRRIVTVRPLTLDALRRIDVRWEEVEWIAVFGRR